MSNGAPLTPTSPGVSFPAEGSGPTPGQVPPGGPVDHIRNALQMFAGASWSEGPGLRVELRQADYARGCDLLRLAVRQLEAAEVRRRVAAGELGVGALLTLSDQADGFK